jgi:hypothetical protein
MLADIAAPYVGATEAAGNRMGEDQRMREIFEADDLADKDGTTDGYAWCCAFVSVCVQRLLAISPMYPGVRAPRVASVSLFRTGWAPAQKCLIFAPSSPHAPHKGDIVVFTFSHIGIVGAPAPARSKPSKATRTNKEAAKARPAGESSGRSLRFGASSVCRLPATAADSVSR